MPDATLIDPDVKFKRQLMETGGETLRKCFQCGTCTVVCPISPDASPFPRKEILWAQWGLKDRLMRDPDLWLCHQCNDCATHCPRGAYPGDVMAALRRRAIEHYAAPRFLARWVNEPKCLPLLLAIPAVLLLAVIGFGGGFQKIQGLPAVSFDQFFNHLHLDVFFVGFSALAALGALTGVVRFWKGLALSPLLKPGNAGGGPIACATRTGVEVLAHSKFRQCKASSTQFLGHMGVFYGFVGLFATTSLAFLLLLLGKPSPFPIGHPVKILGNASGVVFLIGWAWVLRNRMRGRNHGRPEARDAKEAPGSSYADWLFLWIIGATVITGFLAYGARVINNAPVAYPVYFVHLVLVFFLLVYLPYSKFAHLLYRTVALYLARQAGREAPAAPANQTAPASQDAA